MSLTGHYGNPATRLALTVLTAAARQLDRPGRPAPFVGLTQVPALTAWIDAEDGTSLRVDSDSWTSQDLTVTAVNRGRRTTLGQADSLSSLGHLAYQWLRTVIPDAYPVAVVDTPEDADRLPARAVIRDVHGTAWQKSTFAGDGWYTLGSLTPVGAEETEFPARILYVPGGEDE